MNAEQDRIHFVAVGIGINVNHERIPDELSKIATSLRIETKRVQSRVEIVARLLRHLDSYYNRFLSGRAGSRSWRASPKFRALRAGSACASKPQRKLTRARRKGSNPSGLLRVRRDDGRVLPVIAGTLSEAD